MKELELPSKTSLALTGLLMSLIFLCLVFIVQSPSLNIQETQWLLWGYQQHSIGLTYFNTTLAYLGGSPSMALVILIICVVAYKKQRIDLSLFTIIVFAGAVAIGWLFKEMVARPRPDLWQQLAPYYGYSFPSNHTIYAVILAGVLVVISYASAWRTPAIIFGLVWCVLMGLSRMYLGAHYPTDVLGGVSLGLAWLCLVTWLFIHFNLFQYRASTTAGTHEVKL